FKGRTEPAFIGWIKRILQNNVAESIHCHITTQKRSVRRERNLNAKQDSDALPIYIDSRQSSPSQRAMKGERIVELASKLDTLPEMQKEALRLRYLEGMTLQTISDLMDKSNMAVAGLLKRGLQQLRQELRDKD
ncbi:MAG: sigma-70 family RNA polymerase sigma factor, partial [Planctomycetota bacterium]|nr:sigma-70 family RNA polymerase sigma factor [Planctomycetota bacterium]